MEHGEADGQRWWVRACHHALDLLSADMLSKDASNYVTSLLTKSNIMLAPRSANCSVSLLLVPALQELRASRPVAKLVLHCCLQLPAELERSARFRAERQAAEAQAAAERVEAAVGATQAAT